MAPFLNFVPAPVVAPGNNDPSFANVVLLLSGDGTNGSISFPDDSPSAHTVSVVNTVTVSTTTPKFGTGCINCPGNPGMTWADNADWDVNPSSGSAFTIEFWLRIDTNTNNAMPLGQYAAGNGGWLFTLTGTGEIRVQYEITLGGGFQSFTSSGASLTTGVWYHVALSKNSSGKMRFHIDGTMRNSVTGIGAFPVSTAELSVGSSSGVDTLNRLFDGQLDEIRITKGVCRYDTDSAITIPTAAFPRS